MKIVNGTRSIQVLLCLLLTAKAIGCAEEDSGVDESIPKFAGDPLKIGALLCVTGPFSAKAATIEQAAILAEEYINGSTRAYADTPVEEIPCRAENMCGAWVGRTAAGEATRGRLKLIIGDSEQRSDRAVNGARLMVDEGVPVIIGPCDPAVLHDVQDEVTKTDVALVTPVATADSVTEIDDRTAEEKTAGEPGWVYRTIAPDYVQAQVLGFLATNVERPPLLVRFEDQTSEDCTTETSSFCEDQHPDDGNWQCLASVSAENEERDFYEYSDTACETDKDCDDLGRNYACVPPESGAGETVCARYRIKQYCTKVVRPQTAMMLYPDTPAGRALRTEVERYWVDAREKTVLSTQGFDPAKPASFSAVVQTLFKEADARGKELVSSKDLPDDFQLADSVVFLLSDETAGALLMQEWQTQIRNLPEGSDKVFWLGTSALRTSTFIDMIGFDTVRNLYLTDPYTTDSNNREFFLDLFRTRWEREAGDFAATVFDTVLLAVAASERAMREMATASPSGALGMPAAVDVKNSLPVVSAGCEVKELPTTCQRSPETFHPQGFSRGLTALSEGKEIRLHGVSGSLALSPEGDRMTEFKIWKVIRIGNDGKGFKIWQRNFTPGGKGITLRK